jgi:hypothetical protein
MFEDEKKKKMVEPPKRNPKPMNPKPVDWCETKFKIK